MNNQAYLCPCCAAHLYIPHGLTTLRCDNCAASLVFVREGGVSGLLLLPEAAPVPYSDPRISSRALDGVALARDAWRDLLLLKVRKRFGYGIAFALFSTLTGATGLGTLVSLHLVTNADKHSLESAAASFLLGLAAIPVIGFVAAFFWERFMAAQHEVSSVRRRLPPS